MNSRVTGRLYWLDVARTIAIVSVIFNHALSRSFSVYQNTLIEFNQMSLMGSFTKSLLYVFSRLGVPLFLMVTGSLLLKREYEDKDNLSRFIKHNWFSLLRTTEIWLVIMFLFLQPFPNSAFRTGGLLYAVKRFFETLLFINQETMVSMWYMAMILIVYLMIPLLSVAIKRIGERYVYILCLIAAVIGMLLPNIKVALEAAGSSNGFEFALSVSDLFSIYVIYIISGYWIYSDKLKKFNTAFIFAGFVISLLMTTMFQLWIYSSPIDYSIRYADIGILLTSIFLFEAIRRTKHMRNNSPVILAVTFISKISFAIYFVHICVMTGINVITDNILRINGFAEFSILAFVSFGVSVILIWLFSKNRFIAKYLFQIKG